MVLESWNFAGSGALQDLGGKFWDRNQVKVLKFCVEITTEITTFLAIPPLMGTCLNVFWNSQTGNDWILVPDTSGGYWDPMFTPMTFQLRHILSLKPTTTCFLQASVTLRRRRFPHGHTAAFAVAGGEGWRVWVFFTKRCGKLPSGYLT